MSAEIPELPHSTTEWVVSTSRIEEILRAFSNLEQRTTILPGSIINMMVYGEAGSITVTAEKSNGLDGWVLGFDLSTVRPAR